MSPRAPLVVILLVGGLLIAGTLGAGFAISKPDADAVTIHFVRQEQPAQPVDEPLFPGLPVP